MKVRVLDVKRQLGRETVLQEESKIYFRRCDILVRQRTSCLWRPGRNQEHSVRKTVKLIEKQTLRYDDMGKNKQVNCEG